MNGIWRRISAEPAVHRAGSDSPSPAMSPEARAVSLARLAGGHRHRRVPRRHPGRTLRPALDATNLIPPAP